jgi:hypothetical protein
MKASFDAPCFFVSHCFGRSASGTRPLGEEDLGVPLGR